MMRILLINLIRKIHIQMFTDVLLLFHPILDLTEPSPLVLMSALLNCLVQFRLIAPGSSNKDHHLNLNQHLLLVYCVKTCPDDQKTQMGNIVTIVMLDPFH